MPEPAPVPYGGDFLLSISGHPPIALSEVAGCFDKIIGVEYEDCYLTTRVMSQDVFEWLDDMTDGTTVERNLTLYQVTAAQVTAQLTITGAFIRDFTVSDIDAASSWFVTLRLIVVPRQIQAVLPSGSIGPFTTTPTFRSTLFRMDIFDIQGDNIDAVRGIHASWPKVPAIASGSRRQFMPGPPAFGDISVDVSTFGAATTAADFDQWVKEVAGGSTTTRDGEVDFYTDNTFRTVVGRLHLFDLFPGSFLPFANAANQRTITLSLGRFALQ